MVEVSKLLHTKTTTGFLSFLIGMGIVVLLFHKPYTSYQFLSIPVSNVEGRIVRHGQKCYTYMAEDCLCPHVNKDAR